MGDWERPTEYGPCSDCGKVWPDYELFQRRGEIFGPCCLLKTADRQAYEKWFVDSNS